MYRLVKTPCKLETLCKLLFDWSNKTISQGDRAEAVLVLEIVRDACFSSTNALTKVSVMTVSCKSMFTSTDSYEHRVSNLCSSMTLKFAIKMSKCLL